MAEELDPSLKGRDVLRGLTVDVENRMDMDEDLSQAFQGSCAPVFL